VDRAQLRSLFENVNVWKRGSERAPHKPLLLLYALGKCSRGEPRPIPYSEVDQDLQRLLREFGPSRKSYHPEYPFWWLQNDGLWELSEIENLETRKGHTDLKKSELLRYNVTGGFPEPIYNLLCQDSQLVAEITQEVLDRSFPSSIHEDILDAVGIELNIQVVTRTRRAPDFRDEVMRAYECRCAVCGLDMRLGTSQLGVEAAHIKWHQAGGPDIVQNGLALCTLHHKMFDRGALTISQGLKILVSEHVHGTSGFEEWVLSFHGKELRVPQSPNYYPWARFLKWHFREVFRAPARYSEAVVV